MYSLALYKAACVDADQQGLPVQDKDFSLKVLFEYLKKVEVCEQSENFGSFHRKKLLLHLFCLICLWILSDIFTFYITSLCSFLSLLANTLQKFFTLWSYRHRFFILI